MPGYRLLNYRGRYIKISGKRGKFSCVEFYTSGWYTVLPRCDETLLTLSNKLRIAKSYIDEYVDGPPASEPVEL